MTMVVDGVRHEFLSRSGLSGDQHGRVAIGQYADGFLYLPHRLARADQPVLRHCGIRTRMPCRTGHHAIEHARQVGSADGFCQMIEGAEAHRLNRVRRGRMRGQHSHRRGPRPRADMAQHFEPVHSRHAKIQKHGIRGFTIEQFESLATGRRRARVMAEIAHRLGHCLPHRGIVIDDQDGRHGRTISKVVPDCTLANRAIPPWTAATS
jgi:hypothetical protein